MINILILEDVETDAELVVRQLRKANIEFDFFRVENRIEFQEYLHNNAIDIIISDYSLPTFNALEALEVRNDGYSYIPFILVTGAQTEEIAVQCIKSGANDYILKNSLTRLPTSVLNNLAIQKIEKEKNNAITQLEEREKKYRHLFENSLVGIIRWKLDSGEIIEANKKAEEFTQLTCKDRNFFSTCFLDASEYTILLENLVKKDEITNFQFRSHAKGGDSVWLSLSAKVYVEENEIEAVIQDISESKESLLELEQLNYELDRFVYHASHDLKSPLNSINGLIQAARDVTNIEDCHQYLELFEECTRKLDELLNDLTKLARSNRAEELLSWFNFEKEIEDVLLLLNFHNQDKKITVKTEIVLTDTDFLLDAVRLRIIMNNLIGNAFKYHRNSDNQYINISVKSIEKNYIRIEIEDNGEGIADSEVNKVFDMFYRATESSTGSGLGLYIVKTMVDKMNGRISLQSQLGQGSKFTIEIPKVFS